MSIRTETETVVKRILPYLERRGYSITDDLDFETAVKTTDRYSKGYIDILVTLGKKTASFLIEAKRMSKQLTTKDRDQAINYGKSTSIKVPFVVVTNGTDIHCYNTKNKKRILWNGKNSDKIPSKEQLKQVMRTLKANPDEITIRISNDKSLPYRPGLPLRQLNALFYKGHSTIRKNEKNEEYAFADFSKLLFLKLLEEKSDIESGFVLPYSYRFYELAEYPINNADRVRDAILSMIDSIKNRTPYGEVLDEVDSKGAAFEY